MSLLSHSTNRTKITNLGVIFINEGYSHLKCYLKFTVNNMGVISVEMQMATAALILFPNSLSHLITAIKGGI